MEIHNQELRRAVSLTTEWVRAQFRFYLVCLLRTSLETRDKPVIHHFNSHFYAALETTHWHKAWARHHPSAYNNIPSGHPCSGQLSVSDVKLRLSHTMHNTEGGKRVSAAVSNTGKAVAGGLGAAKGALSAWWGGLRQDRSKSPSPPGLSPRQSPTSDQPKLSTTQPQTAQPTASADGEKTAVSAKPSTPVGGDKPRTPRAPTKEAKPEKPNHSSKPQDEPDTNIPDAQSDLR